tara:strand:- start:5054 stop:5281 length:228 start_codon:yes stop_codon:yes gene_type:complete
MLINEIKQIMADILSIPISEIGDEAHAESIEKWDSLNHMNMMIAIEQQLGIVFTESELVELNSLQSIVESIELKK